MKLHKVKCEIYQTTLVFFIKRPREEMLKYVKRHKDLNDGIPLSKAITLYSGEDDTIIIWTPVDDTYNIDLVHECVHAANIILDSIDWQPQLRNDEPQAYLTEWIYRKALKLG